MKEELRTPTPNPGIWLGSVWGRGAAVRGECRRGAGGAEKMMRSVGQDEFKEPKGSLSGVETQGKGQGRIEAPLSP